MIKMYYDYLKAFMSGKKGQGMVEYGLIIGLIAVVLIAALGLMTGSLQSIFSKITDKLNSVS